MNLATVAPGNAWLRAAPGRTAERPGELAALIKPTAPTLTSLAMSEADIADAASPALFQIIGTCFKLPLLLTLCPAR